MESKYYDFPITLRYYDGDTPKQVKLDFWNGYLKDLPSQPFSKSIAQYTFKPDIEREVTKILGVLPALVFIDEDGDKITLNDVDSYIEAMKVAKKTGELLIIAVDRKPAVASRPPPVLPVISSGYISEMAAKLAEMLSSTGLAPMSASTPSPALLQMAQTIRGTVPAPTPTPVPTPSPIWLQTELQKMKVELKKEILEEIAKPPPPTVETIDPPKSDPVVKQSSQGGARPKVLKGDYIGRILKNSETPETRIWFPPPTEKKWLHKVKTPKGNYISRALNSGGGLSAEVTESEKKGHGGAKPKISKGDYISRTLNSAGGLSTEVTESEEKGHGGAKPKKGDYISRTLNSAGGLSSQASESHNIDSPKTGDATVVCGGCGQDIGEPYFICLDSDCMSMLCRQCEIRHPTGHAMLRLPKRLDGGRHRAATAARMILLSMSTSKQHHKKGEKKVDKAIKKAAKIEAGHVKAKGKRSADCITMEVVIGSGENAGTATVTWMIVNTGKKPWDNDVKLLNLASSDSDLKPINWELPVPALKCGEDAIVTATLTIPSRSGEYKTFWILSRRGKRFADLAATIDVPKVANVGNAENIDAEVVMNVVDEHSYAIPAKEVLQNSPTSEASFERIDEVESPGKPEDERSLFSVITECKSNGVEQDYDIIPGNDICGIDESVEELEEQDSSYVSIASPVVVDDACTDLTELWQRLSISLSSSTACPPTDGEMEVDSDGQGVTYDGHSEPSVEIVDNTEPLIPSLAIIHESEVVITAAAGDHADVVLEDTGDGQHATVEETVTENTDLINSDGHSIDGDQNEMRGYNTAESISSSTSRSNSFDNKRHQLSATVTNAISNALQTTTQTLATVGATAREIHTAASAIVRTNFHGHGTRKDSWQQSPPRAWVPKATQTGDEESSGSEVQETREATIRASLSHLELLRQTSHLVEMGFLDLEQNERLLRQFHGDFDRAVLALLEENGESKYV